MKQVRLGLIGFGNVGQGLAQILAERAEEYARKFGLDLRIVAITDALKGSVYNADGLAPSALLEKITRDGNLVGIAQDDPGICEPGWDALDLVTHSNADVIVELSYTDLKTGEPAASYIEAALRSGKHTVTTNKGPVALHYARLQALAEQNGVKFGVEGSVMSGTPALRLGMELLAGAGVRKVQGILNGTTNFILTQMELGMDYTSALAEAQRLDYAEADPTGDVEGFDAAGKVVILARLLFGKTLRMDQVDRHGITQLTPLDIASATAAGERWKLIGTVECINGGIRASVCPQRLPISHPLAGVSGATNAACFTTDLLGEVTLIGPGAGRLATGYAVIEDILAIYR